MDSARSPLFPDTSLVPVSGRLDQADALIPQLPSSPLIQTSSFQLYIVPAEKHLYVQGFSAVEHQSRPPTLLRGSLVLKVFKPSRFKTISLSFRGTQRTDWPEGIPPKRNQFVEINDLVNHSWPFYNIETHLPNNGADIYAPLDKNMPSDDVTHLSLDASNAHHLNVPDLGQSFAASIIKRATSPLAGASSPPSSALSPVSSFPDVSTVLSSSSSNTMDLSKPGLFSPGNYVYNFEHPIPASSPESVNVTFGEVSYYLEAHIIRQTTFKSNLTAKLPLEVIRIPSDNSVEENEPIIIERDWEDQMKYEIIVASKSVVLDSYLPMSLKFVPLFGKVALHRIRVYITQDCVYFCNNKSVHRNEPSRKYLLLEHKALKNRSLLSKDGGRTPDADPSEEILPRELEFQVYVPSTINKKFSQSLSPDTAVENIQCNHWIKISLRISKPDPNIKDKRKHFEISIDSPIHLFSTAAAHNNTLLPVYRSEPEFLPEYTLSPVLSPGVTAVDASINPVPSMSDVLGFSSSSNTAANRPTTCQLSPHIFHHITSQSDSIVHRDNDMHLDSNLYKPEDDDVLTAIGSPQAMPFTPVSSPLLSPTRGIPEPSIEPPSFHQVGLIQDTLPPAYNRQDPHLELSPLRIDDPSDHINESGSLSSGIKSKLNKQLERRGRSSISDKESLNSDLSSTKSANSKSSKSSKSSNSIRLPKPKHSSKDEDNRNQQDDRSSTASFKPAEVKPFIPVDEPSTDIADLGTLTTGAKSQGSISRNSSISSANFMNAVVEEAPLGQTRPLLSLSSASVNEQRLSFESERSYDPSGSVTDLVSTNALGVSFIPESLTNFRNPRLTKHYQEPEVRDTTPIYIPSSKTRQKSFGVIPDTDAQSSEIGHDSDGTLNEMEVSRKQISYLVHKEAQQMMS